MRWRRVLNVAAALLLGAGLPVPAAAPGAACAPLCHCRGDHLACDAVPFHRFPHTEESVRHVSVSSARLGALGEAALDARELSTLVLVGSHLHHIEADALASMASTLASLDLGYNEFTEVPIEALRELKVLNWLNLQNNYISELDPDTEWGSLAESLSSLSLDNNHLCAVREGALSALRQLAQLDLEGNRLHAVAGGALPPALALLRLSDNLLPALPCAALAGLPRLRHLHLRNNMLRPAINRTCRAERLRVDSLDLSQNELDDLFVMDFQHRMQLKQLILDLNDFTSIPPFVLDSGRLERLSIAHNRLSYVSETTIHALKRDLDRLELDHNELTSLTASVRELARLRHLSLAYNKLEELHHVPPHLHYLSVAGNYLTGFPAGLRQLKPSTLMYLDVGYNRLSSVTAHDFGPWAGALTTLNLRGNRISVLSANAFPAAIPLRELMLSFNELYYVEANAFANLTRLQMLELSTSLFNGDFPLSSDSGTLSWMSLDNNNIHYVSTEHLERFPSLEYLNLDFNKILEFPSDVVEDERFAYRLKELRLSYNYISKVNPDFLKNLADLQSIDLSYNRMRNITEHTFTDLQNLVYVNLAGNLVETIGASALAHLPRLSAIDLHDNYLTEFSTHFFENVSNNENNFSVNVSFNRITSLSGGDATGLINVLDLSHNLLGGLSKAFFECLGPHIRQLMLSHNRLTFIDNAGFGSLPNLQILNLNNNRLGVMKRRVFTEMPSLQILDLSQNQIHQLSVEQFHSLRNLRHLRLDHNELRSLPRDCFKNTVLEHLDLGDNQLTIFPSSALAQVGFTLRRLELARNRLEYLDAAMFHTIAFLHELNLARNALTVLSDNTFMGLARLRRLNLSGNAIKTNFKELFHNLPRLRRLALADAGLKAVPHLPLANLTELDLSGNLIASYREPDVRRFAKLRTLNLARNRFTSLQPAMWAALPRLVFLDVSANPVVRITRGTFEGLDRLLGLNLERLRYLEAVEPRAFRPLVALRSLSVESPMTPRGEPALAEVAAATRALEALTVTVRGGALDSQLHGMAAPRLRALEVRGAALRRVSARAFVSLGRQRALSLRLRGTAVAALPAGLVRPLAHVTHLGLDFSDNRLVSFSPAALYPNLTGWNRLATKLVPGGLMVSGDELRCGCAVSWVGAWLRRWTAEVGGWSRGARAAARASVCRPAGEGGALVPLVALAADEAECHASALSSRASPPRTRTRTLDALLWTVLLHCIS